MKNNNASHQSYVSAPSGGSETVITPLGKVLRKTCVYAMYGSLLCMFLLPFSELIGLISVCACFTVGLVAAILTDITGMGFSVSDVSEKTKESEMKVVRILNGFWIVKEKPDGKPVVIDGPYPRKTKRSRYSA